MTPNTNDCDSLNDRYGSPEAVVNPEGEKNRVLRSSTTLPVEVIRERTVLPVCQALYVDSCNDKTVLCVLAFGQKTNDDKPLVRNRNIRTAAFLPPVVLFSRRRC